MATTLISLSLYDAEIDLLDQLVDHFKKNSITPKSVNRSFVIRELLVDKMIEIKKKEREEEL